MTNQYLVKRRRIQNNHCEINVAEHCNLACRSCSHLSPIMPASFVDPARVYEDLQRLARVYHAGRVSLLGGEPLLHPGLTEVAEAVRRSGVSGVIRIVTNGTLLPRMRDEVWRSIDEVRVSEYPGFELTPEQRTHCEQEARRHHVRLYFSPTEFFRESYAGLGTTDAELVAEVYSTCEVAHDYRCQVIADGYFYKCPQSYFHAKAFSPGAPRSSDAIAISDDEGFGRELLAFLESPEPLEACSRCLGTVGKRFAHEQIARADWRMPQEQTTEDLIDQQLLARAKHFVPLRSLT